MRRLLHRDDLEMAAARRGSVAPPRPRSSESTLTSGLLGIQRDAGNKAATRLVAGSAGLQVSRLADVQRVPAASLQNFGTRSITTGAANSLHHEVQWESSSGSLADLGEIKTRERVSWEAAPAEFGAAAEYATPGSHTGLGTNTASGGFAVDDHSIIPTGFRYALPTDGESQVWKMRQQYEMSVDGGAWAPIPDSNYEITRWFERRGSKLVAYVAKRGIQESVMHRALVSVDTFFT